MPLEQAVAYALGREEEAAAADDGLTPREREVAALLRRGLTNRQIAEQLVIGERTVETHVERILRKLGLSSRVQVGRPSADRP